MAGTSITDMNKTDQAVRLLKRAAWHFEQAWKCARTAQEIYDKAFPGQGGAHARVKPSSQTGREAVGAALKRLTGKGG